MVVETIDSGVDSFGFAVWIFALELSFYIYRQQPPKNLKAILQIPLDSHLTPPEQ
jgi:hypothetical protein